MFFFLSKTVSYLLMPFTMAVLLLVIASFLKHGQWKFVLRWVSLGILLFFSNGFIANLVMYHWEVKPVPYATLQPYQLGVVLTGATMSAPYTTDRVYFHKGADRVTHAVQLYKLGLIKKILISGGSGRLTGQAEPEANQFMNAMLLMGVDSAAIIIENDTRNTHESAVAVKPILDSLGYSSAQCLLITSAFHMRRSLACYRKAGLDLKPFSTDFYTHEPEFALDEILIPGIEAMVMWQKMIREWIGFVAYKAAGYI